ncbi:hypothetical protein JCM10049v2_007554 [Rhodotorula toruloides]
MSVTSAISLAVTQTTRRLKSPPQLSQHGDTHGFCFKQITVTQTAFTTYRAVLAFLRTGHISFAPLSSSFASRDAIADAGTCTLARPDFFSGLSTPDRPWPVSPKSAFRLAHLLELDTLQTMCLTRLSRSLTPDTAPIELVDDASVRYDAWRNVVIEYIVEQWDKVMETESWKDVYARIERDELPGLGPVLLKLMDKKLGAGKW